jgi:hypothetical protein
MQYIDQDQIIVLALDIFDALQGFLPPPPPPPPSPPP